MMTRDRHEIGRENGETPDTQALAWFVRMNDAQVSEETQEAFFNWLSADPENQRAWHEAETLWANLDQPARRVEAGQVSGLQAAWKPALRKTKRWPLVVTAMAAVLALAMAIPSVWLDLQADFQTRGGENQQVSLNDGSSVLLNGATALRLPDSTNQRRLDLLSGEAFFDVKPDPSVPFVVVADGVEVRVLGTGFNVRRIGDSVTVTVAHGQVAVSYAGTQVHLNAAQSVDVRAGRIGPVERSNLGDVLSWQNGQLQFDREPLGNVVTEIDRLRDGRILIGNPLLRDKKVSGVFHSDNPDAIFRALYATLGIKTLQLPGTIVVLY